MPVTIGQTADSGFDRPFGLMTDCHRRIEKFLAAMITVTEDRRGAALDSRQRDAMEKSLRYFQRAAPWHTDDEEQSLFPRLRQRDDEQVRNLLEKVAVLEADHRAAETNHKQVHELVTRWLDQDSLDEPSTSHLLAILHELKASYQRHIALEDDEVFPLAEKLLSPPQLQAIGREMASRRGVDPNLPPRRCKHGSHQ